MVGVMSICSFRKTLKDLYATYIQKFCRLYISITGIYKYPEEGISGLFCLYECKNPFSECHI